MKKGNLGKCYKLGFEYLMSHFEWILIHGYITNIFPPYQTIDHCWLQKDDIIYDPVFEKTYDINVYSALFKTEIAMRYSFKEALKLADKTGHYGCWHNVKELNSEQYYDANGHIKNEYNHKIKKK